MPKGKKSVLSQLRRQLKAEHLADDVSIVYRVQGGSAGERLDESVVLSAAGGARVQVSDELNRKHSGDARDELGREAVLDLARTIVAGVDDLIPRSEARFVPGSLVGSVSIGIGDETETYYFHADDDATAYGRSAVPSGVSSIVGSFDNIEKRCLEGGGDAGGKDKP